MYLIIKTWANSIILVIFMKTMSIIFLLSETEQYDWFYNIYIVHI